MYKVKLNNRILRNKQFETWEAARAAVRKIIRAKEKDTPESVKAALGWDSISRNPSSIKDFGYQIVKAPDKGAMSVGLTD